jgi:hypothetical protein
MEDDLCASWDGSTVYCPMPPMAVWGSRVRRTSDGRIGGDPVGRVAHSPIDLAVRRAILTDNAAHPD